MNRILVVLLLLSFKSFAQDTITIKSWKSFPLPTNEDTLVKYNWSKIWWKVILKENNVYAYNNYYFPDDPIAFKTAPTLAEKALNVKGTRISLKVNDGYLIAMNYGEWGGELSWYSFNGESHKKISGHKILKLLAYKNLLYGLDGYGNIVQLIKYQNEWQVKNILKLPDGQHPSSFALDNQNNFIVITDYCLFKIDNEGKITKIIENGFWKPYLHPTSIVIKDNIVYSGMPMGIFKYNLDTKTKEWLMPK